MKSIRSKLWLAMMLLTGSVLIFLWLFQIVFLDQFYEQMITKRIMKQEYEIAASINADETGTLDLTSEEEDSISSFAYEKQINIMVLNTSMNTVYEVSAASGTLPGMQREAYSLAYQEAQAGNSLVQEVKHQRWNVYYELMSVPIEKDGTFLGIVLVMYPKASLDETAVILKQQLIIISGLLLLIAAALSFALAKHFTSPILQISKTAKEFEQGNFGARIQSRRSDELGVLASQMNSMGEALSRNEVLQKELVANVSHELRTPLTLIRGYAETLLDVTGEDKEKRDKQLTVIVNETERLGKLVAEILDLSQLKTKASGLEIEEIPVSQLLLSVYEHYEDKVQEGRITVNAEGTQDSIVKCDSKRILQVFLNLIDNAFLHAGDGTIVRLVIAEKKDVVIFEVKDNGKGIEKEELPHIFDRYYRGENTKKGSGTGLGLAIVKEILELHKAIFSVHSEPENGTTFWFTLQKGSHTSF